MKSKLIYLLFIALTSSILFSQEKEDAIFKDTLFFKINTEDFLPFKESESEELYYRNEEKRKNNPTYFFCFKNIKKPKSSYSLIDLNKFLRREEFFDENVNRFKYENIFKGFYDNVIIFVDEKGFEDKFYLITPVIIIE